ncbi:MAG: T9SS type A sorting domain-containing protein [Ignavibacteria bacterium]|nr:T9SS type A sorting domain-containing protein [Ignavibacteria bacterium]
MKKFILFTFFTVFNSFFIYSQWIPSCTLTNSWSSTSFDVGNCLKFKDGFIYITGASRQGSTDNAIRTIKMNSSCSQQWVATYTQNSITPLEVKGIDVDASGNVYIVGYINNGNDYDIITLKYNSSGTQQWTSVFDRGGNDKGNAIVVDRSGNVYITGSSDTLGTSNIRTIKYNSSGVIIWAVQFDKGGSLSNTYGNDEAFGIAIDDDNSHPGYGIYVVGWYDNGMNCQPVDGDCEHDAQIIHYTTGGTVGGHRHYGCGPNNEEDWATNVVVAPSGNVYAVGAKYCLESDAGYEFYGHEFMVMKCYWSNDQTPVFRMDYDYCGNARYFHGKDGGEKIGVSLVVDENEYVYATGYGEMDITGSDYLTIKFNTDGTHSWVNTYNSAGNVNDKAYDIAINDNSVFVTGISDILNSGSANIVTVKYNRNNGSEQCVAIYNGNLNTDDGGYAVDVDGNNVYVGGVTNFSTVSDMILLKYTECNDNEKDNLNDTSLRLNKSNIIPATFDLFQNYPNPFNPSTIIQFDIPSNEMVNISVYNSLGQIVAVLVNENITAGTYKIDFDASSLPNGIYLYTLNAGNFSKTLKMVLIK